VLVALLAMALGVVVAVALRPPRAAHAAAGSGAEADDSADPADPASLTPVPMSVEPTGPSRPPTAFAALFASGGPRTTLSSSEEGAIVARARLELDRVTVYDNTWMETSQYPMGDVPASRGACTDVVVRSLRAVGVDLQELVHEDIARDAKAYGLAAADVHIDHRRIGTMFTFFQRHAMALPNDVRDRASFRPGDVVFVAWQWVKAPGLAKQEPPPEHVGVVSDRIGPRGLPLIIENGGPKPVEADSLGRGKIVGHFRALQRRR